MPSAARATAARRRSPRRAPSTCSSRSTTWATASRARSSCARRRSARRTTGRSCGPGLVKDDLQVVSTDHCPFDFHGQKELGRGDFRKIPNGLPGVEDRVDLLHDGGVVAGRISKERWVEIISTAPGEAVRDVPAQGLDHRRRGRRPRRLRPGPRADDLGQDAPHGRRLLVLRGLRGPGRSDVVLSRGSVVVRDGEFTGRKGHGRFVKRATADYARLA